MPNSLLAHPAMTQMDVTDGLTDAVTNTSTLASTSHSNKITHPAIFVKSRNVISSSRFKPSHCNRQLNPRRLLCIPVQRPRHWPCFRRPVKLAIGRPGKRNAEAVTGLDLD
jgi:hypothetical protein